MHTPTKVLRHLLVSPALATALLVSLPARARERPEILPREPHPQTPQAEPAPYVPRDAVLVRTGGALILTGALSAIGGAVFIGVDASDHDDWLDGVLAKIGTTQLVLGGLTLAVGIPLLAVGAPNVAPPDAERSSATLRLDLGPSCAAVTVAF